jgi:polyhydroxyalkanoate synthesis regulator phasin
MPRSKSVVKASPPALRGKSLGLVGRARAEAETLVKDARRVGDRVQKRAEKVVHDFERRAEKLVGTIEGRAVKAMAPVLAKTFATRRDVQELRVLVAELARKVDDLARRSVA